MDPAGAGHSARIGPMNQSLVHLGFTPWFSLQLTLDDMEQRQLARVMQVQRSQLVVSDGESSWSVDLRGRVVECSIDERATVGDWVVLDNDGATLERVLERKSVFKRVGAGNKTDLQLIAANIDTLFIVTSCNDDFNESRLERYLAVATEAGVDPVIVITRADQADDPETFQRRASALQAGLPVIAVNALDTASLDAISPWVSAATTVALVGSSGVGKSSIVNLLAGEVVATTGAIREQDSSGRHTTTYRSLYRLPAGGLLLDVPGMRELKVAQLDNALDSVFQEVEMLAQQCRFSVCTHGDEPNCAVQRAISSGALDRRRLQNYQKLLDEEARNNQSLAQRRQQDRDFGKMVRQHVQYKHRDR